ncbi:hypothetical protein CAEBREN_00922 [Caenorhabditis brenneri]|uniref:Uncharacterized protein n=1 Tax=Caenorhabditis brenneri TaxID=135651 RepID=G0PGL8_CAEBE|nr:hypothetical protein CAEBREN_00922 [Caenorhabditis brenneri]
MELAETKGSQDQKLKEFNAKSEKTRLEHLKQVDYLQKRIKMGQVENQLLSSKLSEEQSTSERLRASLEESEKEVERLKKVLKAKADQKVRVLLPLETAQLPDKSTSEVKKTVSSDVSQIIALNKEMADEQAKANAQRHAEILAAIQTTVQESFKAKAEKKAKAEAEEKAKIEAKAQIYAQAYVQAKNEAKAKARAEAENKAKSKPLCCPQSCSSAETLPKTQSEVQVKNLQKVINQLIKSHRNSSEKYLEQIRCLEYDIQKLTEKTDYKIEDLKKEVDEKDDKILELQKELWKVIDERQEARLDAEKLAMQLCNNWQRIFKKVLTSVWSFFVRQCEESLLTNRSMDNTQVRNIMKNLDGIIQAVDPGQPKKEDHVENQETFSSNVDTTVVPDFEAWKKGIPKTRNDSSLEDRALNLIRELQDSNNEQKEKISNLQTIFSEIQAQSSSKVRSQQSQTSVNDAEDQETPILTPPTPEAPSKIRILSDPTESPLGSATQADNNSDRISKFLSPTGTLTQAKDELASSSNASEPVARETPAHYNQDSDTEEAQDTLQAKIESLEETLYSKTRHITNLEHYHEETLRMMTEQLDNVYSRLNPTTSDSTDLRDAQMNAQMEALVENNKELNKILQQNIAEAESIQNVQGEYIKELEKELKELQENQREVLRLEKELREREGPDLEMEDHLRNYKRCVAKSVPECMMKENEALNKQLKNLKVEMTVVREKLKDALAGKVFFSEDLLDLDSLPLRGDSAAARKSKKSSEKTGDTDL